MSLAQASIARAADQTALAVSLRLAGHTVGNVTTEEGETNYLQRLGQTIAEVRILAGLSQDQLASRLGRSAAALSRWENGKVAPTAWDLRRLADLLAVPADLLLYPPERPPSPVEIRLQQAVRDGLREAEVRGPSRAAIRSWARRTAAAISACRSSMIRSTRGSGEGVRPIGTSTTSPARGGPVEHYSVPRWASFEQGFYPRSVAHLR